MEPVGIDGDSEIDRIDAACDRSAAALDDIDLLRIIRIGLQPEGRTLRNDNAVLVEAETAGQHIKVDHIPILIQTAGSVLREDETEGHLRLILIDVDDVLALSCGQHAFVDHKALIIIPAYGFLTAVDGFAVNGQRNGIGEIVRIAGHQRIIPYNHIHDSCGFFAGGGVAAGNGKARLTFGNGDGSQRGAGIGHRAAGGRARLLHTVDKQGNALPQRRIFIPVRIAKAQGAVAQVVGEADGARIIAVHAEGHRITDRRVRIAHDIAAINAVFGILIVAPDVFLDIGIFLSLA